MCARMPWMVVAQTRCSSVTAFCSPSTERALHPSWRARWGACGRQGGTFRAICLRYGQSAGRFHMVWLPEFRYVPELCSVAELRCCGTFVVGEFIFGVDIYFTRRHRHNSARAKLARAKLNRSPQSELSRSVSKRPKTLVNKCTGFDFVFTCSIVAMPFSMKHCSMLIRMFKAL